MMFEICGWIVLRPARFRQWRRFRKYKVGTKLCCCDLRHRMIMRREKPDLLVMTDGNAYNAFYCVQSIEPNGNCHLPYVTVINEGFV